MSLIRSERGGSENEGNKSEQMLKGKERKLRSLVLSGLKFP